MTDPIKAYLSRTIKARIHDFKTEWHTKPYGLPFFRKLKHYMVTTWRTRSFRFAFWGVLVFGSIAFSFLWSFILHLLSIAGMKVRFPMIGPFTFLGWIYVGYLIFSVTYVYRKSALLTKNSRTVVVIFLGFYLCFCVITTIRLHEISLLFWIGKILFHFSNGMPANIFDILRDEMYYLFHG